MHLKYFLDSKYLFEVNLKHISCVLSVLNEFLRHSECSGHKSVDTCERCNAFLKRHQMLAEIIHRFSRDRLKGAGAMNKNTFLLGNCERWVGFSL